MMDDIVLPLTICGVQTALIPRNADSSERVGMKGTEQEVEALSA